MADGSGKNEYMPDGVAVFQFFPQIKNHAQRISCTSHNEPNDSFKRHGAENGFCNENDHPSHADISDGRKNVESTGKEYLEYASDEGNSPNDSQKDIAGHSIHEEKNEGGIASCNQEINADMVHHLHDFFCMRMLYAVI